MIKVTTAMIQVMVMIMLIMAFIIMLIMIPIDFRVAEHLMQEHLLRGSVKINNSNIHGFKSLSVI